MFRPSDILTLFRFIYFVSRYLALGAYFLQTSAQSDVLIRRLVVRLPIIKHIDCVSVLACLYYFDLLRVDLLLSTVGMAHGSMEVNSDDRT